MRWLTETLLLPLFVVAPICGYLTLLTLAAPFRVRQRRRQHHKANTFAVLVPAHNEHTTIARLLDSLATVDYPAECLTTFVVADNCTDATATIAIAHGASVFERTDLEQIGKGYALQWLLTQIESLGLAYDGYVIVDADSVVDRSFFKRIDFHLGHGAEVIQAYYGVILSNPTPAQLLREVALSSVHYLRPAAKMALGASAGLKGNGMCFSRGVIERFGWPTAGLTEDVEFHLRLVAAGIRVRFAGDAVVRAEMPGRLRDAGTQNARWERGRLAAVRREVMPLLRLGLRRRNIAMLDAAVEQLVPPVSIGLLLASAMFLTGIVAGMPLVWGSAALALGLFAAHYLSGMVLARVPRQAYFALVHVPAYVVWKGLLYVKVIVGRRDRHWVRTARLAEVAEVSVTGRKRR